MTAPSQEPLPAPSTPPEDIPPLTAVDPADSEYFTARATFLTPARSQQSSVFLLVTIVLFALSARQGEQGWEGVVMLVGVLLFHELGHWAGMRLFGFQDVQMFFIPFFGAAVSGRNVGAVAWKEALVLLMGPLPGLVLGSILMVRSVFEPSHLMVSLGMLLLFINAFNLLPLAPLDGGKLFQLVLFSRNRFLELAFTLFAGLAMLGLAFLLEAWVLGIVAGLTLFSLPRQWKLLRAVKDLRASNPEVDSEPATLEEPAMRALYAAASTLSPGQAKEGSLLAQRVRSMRDVHQRARMHPPSVLASLGLCAAWGAGLVVMLVGFLALGSGRTPSAPKWAQYQDENLGVSVLMPVQKPSRSAAFYGTGVGSQVDGDTLRARLWQEHDYSVTSWKLEPPPATDAERERLLEELRRSLETQVRPERRPAGVDAPRELAGIAGRHLTFSGDSTQGSGRVREEYWFGVHEGRAFILRAEYDSRLATPSEAERFFASFRPLP